MLSGGDVRPLALVVIGRGQITTPYILVIPSEGDYCFLGRLFSLCSILPSQNDHKHKHSRFLSCPSSPWFSTCSFSSVFLFSWPSCLHVCSAFNVAGYFTLSAFDFSLHSCALLFSIEPLLNHFPPPLLLSKQYNYTQLTEKHRILICQTNKATVPLMSVRSRTFPRHHSAAAISTLVIILAEKRKDVGQKSSPRACQQTQWTRFQSYNFNVCGCSCRKTDITHVQRQNRLFASLMQKYNYFYIFP